jgi:uncharacterized protein
MSADSQLHPGLSIVSNKLETGAGQGRARCSSALLDAHARLSYNEHPEEVKMPSKLFRDPVHDIISLDLEDPVESLLFRLIRAPSFQRLRRIRQLGFANLVYPGAEHSRFGHSLGVVHVARTILQSLRLELSVSDRMEVLCAALLHDIGHGPFSHAIETVTGRPHEHYTQKIVTSAETQIYETLADVDPTLPERISRYYGPRELFPSDRRLFLDIVSSQLDADRLDYILRDGLATGVKIGVYDYRRIIAMFRPYPGPDPGVRTDGISRLAVSHRAREAVDGYLIARFHMFKQVYLHKTVRAAEKMLETLLRRAGQLEEQGWEFRRGLDTPLRRLVRGEELDVADHLSLDDTNIWSAVKEWQFEGDETLSSLSRALLERRLYKTISLTTRDPEEIDLVVATARRAASDAGLDPDHAVLLDRAHDKPYRPYDPSAGEGDSHIPILNVDGTAEPIDRISDFVHVLGRENYEVVRICCPTVVRDRLESGESEFNSGA